MGNFEFFTTPDKLKLVADVSHLQLNINANLRRSNCENQQNNLSKTLGPELAKKIVDCDALAPLVQTKAVQKPDKTTMPVVVDNSTNSSTRILLPHKERFNANLGAIVDHLAPLGTAAYVAKKTYDTEFLPSKHLNTAVTRAAALDDDAYRQIIRPEVEKAIKGLQPTAKALGQPLRPFNFEDLIDIRNRALVEADQSKVNNLFKLYTKSSPQLSGLLDKTAPELRELLKTTGDDLLKHRGIWVQAQNEAREATRAFKLGNYGAIGAALAANFALDQTVFSDKEYSLRTIAADIAAPALALTTKIGGKYKFAAIVGIHFANRLFDATESKQHY